MDLDRGWCICGWKRGNVARTRHPSLRQNAGDVSETTFMIGRVERVNESPEVRDAE